MFSGEESTSCNLTYVVIKPISVFRFQGINSNQSFRDKSGSGSGTCNGAGNRRELRQRKSSNTDQEKTLTDDEIVESCKVKMLSQPFVSLHNNNFQMTYDATGCFHWCPSRNFDEGVMTRQVRRGHHQWLSQGLGLIVVRSFTQALCRAAKSYSPSVSLSLIYLISGWSLETAGDPGLGTMC